jgi:hypothetical protein
MSRTTALRAFLVGVPLAFAAVLTQHPMGTGDFFTEVSENVTAWLAVHYAAAVLFPLMALVIWTLIRGLEGRAATIARVALPIYAVVYGVWEAMFGIANGLLAQTANTLDGEAREGAVEASEAIVSSPVFGEVSVFSSVGGIAWMVGVTGAVLALRSDGVRRTPLILLAIGALMIFHVPPFGPIALICLSAGAYLVERRRATRFETAPELAAA